MKNLLQTMSNLEKLKIEMESTYIDGYQWKTIIENYLLNLIIFQFKMSTPLSNQDNKEDKIDEILNSFYSQFWIEKHQWFIQCYWITADTSSIVYVYTLPYAFQDFFYIGNVRLKSTCPNNNQCWSFDSIHNLYYGHFLSQNLSLSHIHLDNIHYLDLTIPFDESFCHSLIGQQCKVLFITVKQRTDIIDLINNMKNLHALIVQCNKTIPMQKENENLLDWLQQHLPITCLISNSIEISNNICLWIR
ncbi:unnamed protein product [Rotaria sordida]|uniref:Uncharacterized protein n=1 Tax=Rotaria sordida TaxID=392033 RepID=A0A813VFR4_9BILA|nr:unnamed protein product [Rotaria sordida]CAF0875956.1 unnamed protein product [Rotaria sordida]